VRSFALALPLVLFACSKPDPAPAPQPSASVSVAVPVVTLPSASSAPAPARPDGGAAAVFRARSDPKKGDVVSVPGGTLVSGSAPGEEGRDPTLEPVLAKVPVTAFSMDALPYPNDPALAPKTNVTRGDAERLCAERHARLCTEVEWEYACKGPNGDPFATGPAWDPACSKEPASCPSGFGVRALGALREWTSSEVPAGNGVSALPATRGGGAPPPLKNAPKDAKLVDRRAMFRCAHRGRAAETQSPDLGFRCCSGPANGGALPPIEVKAALRKTKMDAAQLATIVASIPELSRIAGDVKLFDATDSPWTSKSDKPHDGVTFITQPVYFSPEPGMDLLVATGHGKSQSWVIALHVLPDDTYRAASYFIMQGDTAPVALAYSNNTRKLYWTSCWQCPGETGQIVVKDDHKVVIVQL
jgi:hypothetical protein